MPIAGIDAEIGDNVGNGLRKGKQERREGEEFAKQLIDRVTKRMQPDHVWELQLGGPDEVSNLKFLDSYTNWHIGTQQIRPQIKNLPTGKKVKIKIEEDE
ncbi:hypothetical protein ACFOU2_19360 [Bacillus songklensis]|uniref:HNH endonuclease n=1 Tax=Bacillus songklensis TaxID=1069116 RepID=A0ABV8B5I1_9BACI